MQRFLPIIFAISAVLVAGCSANLPRSSNVFDVHQFGAKGDGRSLDTASIQDAIDAANEQGGGVVVLAKDRTYLSGTVHLRSNVELQIQAGATLLGSAKRLDYERSADRIPITDLSVTTNRPDYERSGILALILAENINNIAINGAGVIDGQGLTLANNTRRLLAEGVLVDPQWAASRPAEINRPMLLFVTGSQDIRVSGVTFRNAANWVQNYNQSQDIVIDGIRVESTAYWNNDGIQITDSQRVKVLNSFVNSADDGICFKSEIPNGITQDVLIENNTIRSSANALKFGTASHGTFRNIRINDLRVYDTYRSAIALEVVDGGTIEDVIIDGVEARNTGNALFMRLGDRSKQAAPGILRRITIKNMNAQIPLGPPDEGYPFPGPLLNEKHNLIPSSIVGMPGHNIEDVSLENINITFAGGGATWRANIPLDEIAQVPQRIENYPEFSMFGELPAWGFYIRHVDGLKLKNVKLILETPDYRAAIVSQDLRKLFVSGLTVVGPTSGEVSLAPILALKDTDISQISGLNIPDGAEAVRNLGGLSGLDTSQ